MPEGQGQPHKVVAVDLGGTKIRAACVSITGQQATVDDVVSEPTPTSGTADDVLRACTHAVGQVLERHSQVVAVGMAAGGVIDTTGRKVTHATTTIKGWAGAEIGLWFDNAFGLPFAVLNDAHAHGLGEALFGSGRGHHSMLMVAVGTGIGGAVILDGVPLEGVRGAAGHVGHVSVAEADDIECTCGRVGHLEGLASGPGILRLAKRLGVGSESCVDGPTLAAAAARGDHGAEEAYRLAGFATGRVIGGLLNTLDVDVVSLAGGVVDASALWMDAVRSGIMHDAMDVVASTPVVAAVRGSHAALLGAAAYALKSGRNNSSN
ncbi:ROK family protein [Cutibacterium sp. WCA-380-WT-3A]|uniref:ROK family protein n=1 Tax=Cutibacterium porci TaxID=2605781 RepID=A0A7K0J5K6_9ACTN|nr:ROK family protein [Cutibacterium porci]MSS45197.1 ROK family protein [Cutibacterium porci]